MLIALLVPLGLAILLFALVLTRAAIAERATPRAEAMLLGFIVSFFDTLGIGSFAPTAYATTNLHLMPGGGTAAGLPLTLTIIAIAANFGFGVLLNFGVGNYAPTLVTLSLMGMDPRLIFPIMAAGAAVMGAGACVRHIQMGKMDLKVVVGLAIGGIPAVLVAAFIVKTMPIEPLRWLVTVVVVYAAAVMFRSAYLGRRDGTASAEAVPVL